MADQPLIINSESNVLKLRFKSDNLFRYRGFKCRYRAMHPNGVAVINTYLSGEETNGKICNVLTFVPLGTTLRIA